MGTPKVVSWFRPVKPANGLHYVDKAQNWSDVGREIQKKIRREGPWGATQRRDGARQATRRK